MIILIIFTVLCLVLSFIIDRKKTFLGIKKGLKMFLNILPTLFTILILVSVLLFFTPKEVLTKWLGKESGSMGMIIAAVIGSISLIPGFIAFPIGAILVKNGVSYSVIAVFITTLMMVGIVTLPLESKYFGWKVALTRNIISFAGAIIIGLAVGLLKGIL
jgi:uncharacterized membrane protein YraQ (UPF0718 family)